MTASKPELLGGEGGVAAGNSRTRSPADAVGAAAEDDDLLLVRDPDLIVRSKAQISKLKTMCSAFELCCFEL
jgi:hypothetical protein